MCDIRIVAYMTHGSRGGKARHQQDQVIGKSGIWKAITVGSHNNAEWMNLLLEVWYV